MSSNKTNSFLYKICHLTVLAKRNLQFYITQREREHKGGFCSHLLSLRRQFICHLIMTNPHSSFLPLFSLFLSSPLSLLSVSSLFLLSSSPHPIQFLGSLCFPRLTFPWAMFESVGLHIPPWWSAQNIFVFCLLGTVLCQPPPGTAQVCLWQQYIPWPSIKLQVKTILGNQ